MRPVCRAIALMLAASAAMGTAHAGVVNLAHMAGSMGVGAAAAGSPGFNMGGLGNLAQPAPSPQSVKNLGHVAAALAAQVAAQQAAAAAAATTPSNMQNGLGAGGLMILSGGTWSNASLPVQTSANGQVTVTVHQSAAQAVLDWQSFNIGRQTRLDFDQQGNANWSVLNRVFDPSGVPSQILGSIKADGLVLVMNHNGVIFGAGSQVNTGSLIASSAMIDPAQFTTNGIYSTLTGSTYTPAFTNAGGAIIVAPGAQISTNAPSSVTAGGGYVLLMGSAVTNQGVITTPDGQAALAAGDNFILRQGYSTDGNPTSTTRGNEIATQLNPGSASGNVTNSGLIEAMTGDITLVGHTVTQDGVALSTTSVDTRGTIHLLNSASDATGSITLTPNSTTAIVIDPNSGTALDSQRAALIADSAIENLARDPSGAFDDLSAVADLEDESRIEIVTGGTAEFQGGSMALATGGQIAVSAVKRVQVDTGATLDVAGSNVTLPMSANQITVNIQGNEQRDDPLNRDTSDLNDANVFIDDGQLIYVSASAAYATDRYYTAGGLLEVSGYLSNTAHTIGEWTAAGGTITLSTGANGSVVAQTGSNFNLSGGSIQYQTGFLNQSWLLGVDGRVYNVNTAPADIQYVGLYQGFVESHPRWGVTKDWVNPLIAPAQTFEAGYTVGRDAGDLVLSTPTAIFEGDIDSTVVDGQHQDTAHPATIGDAYLLTQNTVPQGATLVVGNYVASGLQGGYDTDIAFDTAPAQLADSLDANTLIPADRTGTAWFDAAKLSSFDLGGMMLTTSNSVAFDAPLTFAPGAQITVQAGLIDVASGISAPSGDVTLSNIVSTVGNTIAFPLPKDVTVSTTPSITIEGRGTIDTHGLWVNELGVSSDNAANVNVASGDTVDADTINQTDLAYLDGGNVTLKSTLGVSLLAGSIIDVSSGGAILFNRTMQGGAGGNIQLLANETDPTTGAISDTAALILNGELQAVGAKGGGTLTISAPAVLVGDATTANMPDQLVLPTSFFSQGFSNYDITGIDGVTVADGAQIDVTEPVYRFITTSFSAPTGTAPSAALEAWTPPLYLGNPLKDTLTQRAGASLAFHAGVVDDTAHSSALVVGTGTTITVDPLQSIVLDGSGQITIDGALHAPGGKISVINDSAPTASNVPSIWIGGDAVLDVAGEAYTAIDAGGRAYGVATDGGAILLGSDQTALSSSTGNIESSNAFIIVRPGSLLDASGASGTFDAAAMLGASAGEGPLTVGGNGGSITLSSYNGIDVDGTMRALAGGPQAAGGTLSVTLETPVYNAVGSALPDNVRVPRTITISQSTQPSSLPDDLQPGVDDPSLPYGQAHLSADQLATGGFDNLSFTARDAILFDGNVNLHAGQSIEFFMGALADTHNDAQVAISAPYVLFGGATGVKTEADQTFPGISMLSTQQSTGTLSVAADLIDFQNDVRFGVSGTVAQVDGSFVTYDDAGFGNVDFTSQGDVRFLVGRSTPIVPTAAPTTVTTTGDVTFTAAQLYPATGAVAGVVAGLSGTNVLPGGTITVNRISDADPALPDSVFGQLTLAAGTIDQGGVVVAPLGQIVLGATFFGIDGTRGASVAINLLPGSITSTSANGLTIPYGGTTDGVTYSYNGSTVAFPASDINSSQGGVLTGVSLDGASISVSKGALIDVSGGGDLTGAGFVSGRGGSVDVLTTALVNVNPTNTFSAQGDPVYAIVPGYGSGYASADGGAEGTAPGIGQQVTIPAGVPGLPAGTYTLLPARYALLPGAFRIELGKAGGSTNDGALATGTGSYVINGTRDIANTPIEGALPSEMVLTPGAAVRDDSQYNEMGYSDFAIQQASTLGQMTPYLPADGAVLALLYQNVSGVTVTAPALTFQGTALFQGVAGGRAGSAVIAGAPAGDLGSGDFEIYASRPTPGFDGFSFNVADLDAINASSLVIGGWEYPNFGEIGSSAVANSVTLRDGVDLKAAEVFLLAGRGSITLDPGAEIDTIGRGAAPFDSSDGYEYDSTGAAVLAVSNGDLNFTNSGTPSSAPISIGAGAQIYSEGTISFSTGGDVTIDRTVRYGTRNLGLNVGTINVGDATSMAGADVPPGLLLSPAVLSQLLAGDTSVGAPALETLTLSASQSFNVYGSVDLDVIDPATGKADLDLVLNTPAIYGYGSASDTATLTVGTLTWSGIPQLVTDGNSTTPSTYQSTAPGSILAGGPGTGSSTLNIVANKIVFGFPDNAVPNGSVTLDRTMAGFSTVNLEADEIDSNDRNTLSVYQMPGEAAGEPGTGGNLNLVTPLLTGEAGSTMAYTAGGVLTAAPAAGSTASTASSGALGAEIDLNAGTIDIGSTIMLPSGKLTMTADGDITLQAGSRLALAGQSSTLFDQTIDSFGGDVDLESTNGNISQQAGAVIDVSAVGNAAGTLTANAANGSAILAGQVLGSGASGFASGEFSITGQGIGDFNALNAMLNAGGVYGARSFDIKQGDLVIGDGVKAQNVTVSVDNGSLTVDGTIDASGPAPGTIRLAATDSLTLSGSAVLDTHGTVLQTDSYGQPIDAENEGVIELTATHGLLTLNGGATLDVSAPDGVARGEINLDASRTGETSGDVNISASGPVTIKGAQSIAVNAFWTYAPTDSYGTIVQDNGDTTPVATSGADSGFVGMDQIDTRSQAFIAAAYNNNVAADTLTPGLQGKLAGLTSYGGAFHLRPGVEIDGTPSAANPDGDLTVAGDIDLSGFRYGPGVNPAVYGSGEPGTLMIRASGNLDIVGSISDGFSPPPASPDDNDWALMPGVQTSSVETLLPVLLNSGTTFPNTPGVSLRYAIPIDAATINARSVIPVQVTLSGSLTLPAGTRLTAPIYAGDGTTVLYAANTVLSTATVLPAGAHLGAGSIMPGNVAIAALNWPAGASLGVFTSAVTISADTTVPFEGIIPTGANLQLAAGFAETRPTGSSGTQGTIDVLAPMLPEGDLSWSMRFVSGADLGAADTRIVKPASVLKASGISGNLTLLDGHQATTVGQSYYYYYAIAGLKSAPLPGSGGVICTLPGFTCAAGPTVANFGNIAPSVVRTGTGDLDMIAGGSFDEQSLYGIYTAGTQSPALSASGATSGVSGTSNPFDLPRGQASDGSGTVLGTGNASYEATLAAYQAWYPEHGGNLLISAQADVTGDTVPSNAATGVPDSNAVGGWLWRQGGPGQATAWWINFGSYVLEPGGYTTPELTGFTGIGTLGGGNLTVEAGGNAGTTSSSMFTALNVTVASTGRVLTDGSLVQTGGGNLMVRIGETLNSNVDTANSSDDTGGVFADLRGDIAIDAGSIGNVTLSYTGTIAGDPHTPDPFTPTSALSTGGIIVVPGDGTVDLSTRGDLVLAGAADAGRVAEAITTPYTITSNGVTTSASHGGEAWFTLWTDATAIDLFSAGGNLTPSLQALSQDNFRGASVDQATEGGRYFYPSSLDMVAASGSVYFMSSVTSQQGYSPVELAPAAEGELDILAGGAIEGAAIDMSGADLSTVATPVNPGYLFGRATNISLNSYSPGTADSLLAFGPDTPTSNLHAGDSDPIHIYAGGDITDLRFGEVLTFNSNFASQTTLTWYIGTKAADIMAGGAILTAGTEDTTLIGSAVSNTNGTTTGFILNANPNDVSTLSAAGDILFSSMQVGGPGLLVVQAGGNFYEADKGTLNSVGPVFDVSQSNRSSGAGITVMAGVGAAGPDYTDFAKLYFNAANQANPAIPDTDPANAGKVSVAYEDQLYAWLRQRFGYAGSESDALTDFLALPLDQQGVFVRQVYFDELNASGLEFNDPTSKRFNSYLRGRDAIATLFPGVGPNDPSNMDTGDITLFGPSGIHTEFGGGIQTLTPGGSTVIGVEGANPPGSAGILTQGSGDIDIYSDDSILLGQSRVFTTFGGNIVAWSATGDVNAGRGAKSTTVYTPPRRVYDLYGNVTLSPDVPTSGAGFATLNPIPEIEPGDVNLVAPLGTVDAGEAGIRVSGNLNIAALHIVNTANIQVQGKTTGIPVVEAVNTGALTAASSAASAATQMAQNLVKANASGVSQRHWIITVQVEGFGDAGGDDGIDSKRKRKSSSVSYNPDSPLQVIGHGTLNAQQVERLAQQGHLSDAERRSVEQEQ